MLTTGCPEPCEIVKRLKNIRYGLIKLYGAGNLFQRLLLGNQLQQNFTFFLAYPLPVIFVCEDGRM